RKLQLLLQPFASGSPQGEQRLEPSLTRSLSFADVRCILRSCMAHYSEDAIADSAVSLRHWILPAIALSFVFHCGLFYYFNTRTLDRFVQADIPRLVPRAFNVNRLQIDQKLLETDSKPAATPGKPAGDFGTIANLTQFDGSFEKDIQELRASPEVPQLKEKPGVDTQSAQTAAAKAKAESAVAIEKELSEVRQQLLTDKPD